MAKRRGTTINNPFLLATNEKKMVVNRFIKPLIAANFEVFVKITKVEDKKNLLVLIKWKKELKKNILVA